MRPTKDQKTFRDGTFDNLRIGTNITVPSYNLLTYPVGAQLPGSIVWDDDTQEPYYSDGTTWIPFGGSGSSSIRTFMFSKAALQTIPSGSTTLVNNWTTAPSGMYQTQPEWSLPAGVFTASIDCRLDITATVTWQPNMSNGGYKKLSVYVNDISVPVTQSVKDVYAQSSASVAIPLSMSIRAVLLLEPADQVWIEVEHNAPIPVNISPGIVTTVAGAIILT